MDLVSEHMIKTIAEKVQDLQDYLKCLPPASTKNLKEEHDYEAPDPQGDASESLSNLRKLTERSEAISYRHLINPLDRLLYRMKFMDVAMTGKKRDSNLHPRKQAYNEVYARIKATTKTIDDITTLTRSNYANDQQKRELVAVQNQKERQSKKELETAPSPPSSNFDYQSLIIIHDVLQRKRQSQIRLILQTFDHPSEPYKDMIDSYKWRHLGFSRQRLAGTCQWFIQNECFERWLVGESPQLLWCWGPAGAGKSTIASLIIDTILLKERRPNIAFYYLGYGKVQSLARIVLSLLEQLCADNQYYPPCLEPFLIKKEKKLQAVANAQVAGARDHHLTLEILFEALIEVSQIISSDTFVILDALDESNMDSVKDFDELIRMLPTLNWKILVTSRRNPNLTVSPNISQIYIHVDDNATDIGTFVNHGLVGAFQNYKSFDEETLERLVLVSQGIFLWAKLNLGMVSKKQGQAKIDAYTMPHRPWHLDPTPECIIQRTLEEVEKKADGAGKVSKTAIVWLTNLKRPLTVAALVESLNIVAESDSDSATVDDKIIDWCDGLVVMDQGNFCVHLAHDEINRVVRNLYTHTYDRTMSKLAWSCIKFLSREEFRGGLCTTEEKLVQLLEGHPFLHYAAHAWARHAREVYDVFNSYSTQPKDISISEVANSRGIHVGQGSQEDDRAEASSSLKDRIKKNIKRHIQTAQTDETLRSKPDWDPMPQIAEIAARLESSPNALLALQVLLYTERSTSFKDHFSVHLLKIHSMSSLHKAARFGMIASVDYSITNYPDLVCKQDREGSIPLHEAAKEGFVDVIQRLLKDNEASLLMTNKYKKTPMHYAKARGHPKAFCIMFDKACKSTRKNYRSFSHIGAGENFASYYCIHSNTSSNSPERKMELVLLDAIKSRNEGLAIVLLYNDVDPACEDSDLTPALHLAVKQGLITVVKEFIRGIANHPLCLDRHGRTSLFSALGTEDEAVGADITKILLEREGVVDLDRRDSRGRHILHEVARMGKIEMLRPIMLRTEDVDPEDGEGKIPLDYARDGGHEDVVDALLE